MENFTKGMSVLAYLIIYSTANLQDFECKKFIYIRPKYFSCMYLALYKLIKTTAISGTCLAIERVWLSTENRSVCVMLVIGQPVTTVHWTLLSRFSPTCSCCFICRVIYNG